MELVSVIVPIYNVEKYLERCIESIRKQSYTDIEIILVDDGSSDGSSDICDKYIEKDDRISVLHKKNGGLGDARNVGLEKAKGKYILFGDSDDRIHEKLVEETVKEAEKNQADIVIFDYIGEEMDGQLSDRFTFDFPERKVINAIEQKNLIMNSCSAVNKLILRKTWLLTNLKFPVGKYYEDLATIPKLMVQAERVVYIKEVYYYYLMREGSIMHSKNFERNFRERTWAADGILNYFTEQNLFEEYKSELEYLIFENTFFVPSKEIVLNDRKSKYLEKFRNYAYSRFPQMDKNKYVLQISGKNKILLILLRRRMYFMMVMMSWLRRLKDKLLNRN